MVNQVSLTKLCAKIIGAVICVFALFYVASAKFNFMILLLLMGLAVSLPPLLLTNESNVKFLSRYLLVGANLTVFVTQCISGHYEPAIPLFIALGALSALYFEPGVVRSSFFSGIALFIVECIYLSVRAGQLIASGIILGELLVAVLFAYVLVLSTVKTGCKYFNESSAKQAETEHLLEELNRKELQTEAVLDSQKNLLVEIGKVADQVAAEAEHLSRQSESLASGATEQASSMEHLSSSVNEVCQHVRETSGYAQQVRENSETMYLHVGAGSEHMTELLTAIREIENRMQAIETIIKSIDDIAFQTNILALNAAVESARAGTAGKGFAVVADEVRRLASNSAQAANATIRVLNDCRDAVKRGVSIADETSNALERIRSSVAEVKEQAFQISDMSAAQLTHFDDMNQELSQVSCVVQSTSSAAQLSSGTVQELTDQVHQLRALSLSK